MTHTHTIPRPRAAGRAEMIASLSERYLTDHANREAYAEAIARLIEGAKE